MCRFLSLFDIFRRTVVGAPFIENGSSRKHESNGEEGGATAVLAGVFFFLRTIVRLTH